MSLRTQIHSAFDEVAPPTFGLPERVVETVLTESPRRRRREQLILRMRVPVSLVAVFMLIALVVGLLVGGRLMQDWNSFHNGAPAGDSYQSEVAQLEAVPWRIPVIHSVAECINGPTNAAGSFGSGPVYGSGGPTSNSNWGVYFHNLAYAETKIAGPILVRARDLVTDQPVVFVGQYAAGPVVGSDTVDGRTYQQRVELVLSPISSSKPPAMHKFNWPFIAGVPTGWSGSTGWQIDGIGFSEVFRAC